MQNILIRIANSLKCIGWLYLGSLILSAGLFAFFEDKTFNEGMWWSCITALTVGYGDIAPVTKAGKWLGIIFSHFWILMMVPLVVANIIVKIIHDHDAFTHEEQESLKRDLKEVLEIVKKQK
ncbi:MAG: potassium channel family protein [Bacteroidales bacterium]